jgi:dienelactone hydrolase
VGWIGAALLLSLSVGACGSSATGPPAAPPEHLQLQVSPRVSAVDTPLSIRVSGLTPGQIVTLSVTSVDANGVRWSSSSTYRAGRAGTVDPATTSAVAGSYTGVDAMGPIDMMTGAPDSAAADSAGASAPPSWPFGTSSVYPDDWYAWASCRSAPQSHHGCDWVKPLPFVFSVSAGRASTSTRVWRGPANPVHGQVATPRRHSFYGVFWKPPAGRDNHIGVVAFTGSMGGVDPSIGALLAARGYPTLDLAYFDSPDQDLPGLPAFSQTPRISLEYFANALRWLGSQPGVDPARLWVMGWSLGTEAALLTGVHYPNLVHGMVVFSPNDAATCQDATWTLAGRPLPCTNNDYAPQQTDKPAAVIPAAKIRGPIEFVCGKQDTVWPSCPNSEAMMVKLAAARDPHAHKLVEYPDAGHGIGLIAPYVPGSATIEGKAGAAGYTPTANPVARAEQWPQLLAFLRK